MEVVVALFKVLSRHLPVGSGKITKVCQNIRFEGPDLNQETSRTLSRDINYSAVIFGLNSLCSSE
jgi:hypothetical protein